MNKNKKIIILNKRNKTYKTNDKLYRIKVYTVLILCNLFLICTNLNITYANELIEIISGITEKTEMTFDEYRIVSGLCNKDTKVVIKQFNDNALKKVSIKNIGNSCTFTEVFKLDIGNNTIKFDVSRFDKKEKLEYLIIRKDAKILKKLLDTNIIFT